VAEYSLAFAIENFSKIIQGCFDKEQLHANIPYYNDRKTWHEVLNIIHSLKLRLALEEDPMTIYTNLMAYWGY
jgi:hypothetical protein